MDRGPQFASKAFIELLKLLGIKSALSTAYHPQTDGTTERVNQEIKAYLSIYCASHPEDWPQALHTLEFTHNNRRHADRQNTVFELMFGESPVAILLSFESTKLQGWPLQHCCDMLYLHLLPSFFRYVIPI